MLDDLRMYTHAHRWAAKDKKWWPWLYEVLISQWAGVLEVQAAAELAAANSAVDTTPHTPTAGSSSIGDHYSGEAGANSKLLAQRYHCSSGLCEAASDWP